MTGILAEGALTMDESVLSQAVAHQSHFEALLDRIPHHLILPPTEEVSLAPEGPSTGLAQHGAPPLGSSYLDGAVSTSQ